MLYVLNHVYLALVLIVDPFQEKYRRYLERFNSLMFLVISYLTFLFTDYNKRLEYQTEICLYLLRAIIVLIVVNFTFIIYESYNINRWNKILKLKVEKHKKMLKEAKKEYIAN